MTFATISALVARRLGAALLGGAVLWAVAREAGPRDCQAIIHVAEDDLEVVLDGRARPREGDRYSPMVCELGPGRHTMTVHRGGRRVHHEVFELGPGEQVV